MDPKECIFKDGIGEYKRSVFINGASMQVDLCESCYYQKSLGKVVGQAKKLYETGGEDARSETTTTTTLPPQPIIEVEDEGIVDGTGVVEVATKDSGDSSTKPNKRGKK